MPKPTEQLEKKLETIKNFFDVESFLNRKSTLGSIEKYYRFSRVAYSILHSRKGFIHFSICEGDKYDSKGFLTQAKLVSEELLRTNAKKVLEIGCGRGANLKFLAQKHQNTLFYGIDSSESQLNYSRKISLPNLQVTKEDFHNLTRFADSSLDIVFVIEAIGYSTNKDKVLSEVSRVLRPGGCFIMVDGFPLKNEHSLSMVENTCLKLVGRGMMLEQAYPIDKFINLCQKHNLLIVKGHDWSKKILPGLERFQKIATNSVFGTNFLCKIVRARLNPYILGNAITTYLMADLIKCDILTYRALITTKQSRVPR